MGLSGLLMDGGGERGEQKNSPLLKCVTQSINLLHPIMMQLGSCTLLKEDPKNI